MTYVRRAVAADLPDLLPLCRAFHLESPHHRMLSFSDARVEQLVMAAMSNDEWLAIVACNGDGALIGMGLFYCMEAFFSEEREIGDLTFWVHPAHRGGRAALMMMKELLAWYKAKGASRIQIGVTTGINDEPARAFFERFGFEQKGILLSRE